MALGTEALCDDLELKPDDFRILIFAWKCNAEQVGFVKEEHLLFLKILVNTMFADEIRGLLQKLFTFSYLDVSIYAGSICSWLPLVERR